MTGHPAVTAADTFAVDANTEIADLVKKASKAAKKLTGFTDGPDINIDRLALDGTDVELEAWRATRLDDARFRELLARWRQHWTTATKRPSPISQHLVPKGLDVYAWEHPEDCDHETVRLGATWKQYDGLVHLTRVHIDLVRVAQQDTTFRLLGPTAALELLGPDGIVQEAHPLRVGVQYAGIDAVYRADQPTWLAPQPEPYVGSHIPYSAAANARAIKQANPADYPEYQAP